METNIINMAGEAFSSIFSPKNTDFDNRPWTRLSLWKSRSPVKFQYTVGAKKKNLRLDALKKG